MARVRLTMAASILVLLPVLVVYVLFQRRIVRGLATTGLK
jgi:ABC-type glycerol-3-phosphate transport system permease component